MSLLERNTCRRGASASRIAAQPWSTSFGTARQSVAIWVPRIFAGDPVHGVEIGRARRGEAGFDAVHAHSFEQAGDLQLFVG